MLDACYAGNIIQVSNVSETEQNIDFSEKFITDFISENETEGRYEKSGEFRTEKYKVICSCGAYETSVSDEISLATKYWEKGSGWIPVGMKKCKLYADSNKDKKITLNELYKYSYKNVKKERAKQHVAVYPKNSSFVIFGRFK